MTRALIFLQYVTFCFSSFIYLFREIAGVSKKVNEILVVRWFNLRVLRTQGTYTVYVHKVRTRSSTVHAYIVRVGVRESRFNVVHEERVQKKYNTRMNFVYSVRLGSLGVGPPLVVDKRRSGKPWLADWSRQERHLQKCFVRPGPVVYAETKYVKAGIRVEREPRVDVEEPRFALVFQKLQPSTLRTFNSGWSTQAHRWGRSWPPHPATWRRRSSYMIAIIVTAGIIKQRGKSCAGNWESTWPWFLSCLTSSVRGKWSGEIVMVKI